MDYFNKLFKNLKVKIINTTKMNLKKLKTTKNNQYKFLKLKTI